MRSSKLGAAILPKLRKYCSHPRVFLRVMVARIRSTQQRSVANSPWSIVLGSLTVLTSLFFSPRPRQNLISVFLPSNPIYLRLKMKQTAMARLSQAMRSNTSELQRHTWSVWNKNEGGQPKIRETSLMLMPTISRLFENSRRFGSCLLSLLVAGKLLIINITTIIGVKLNACSVLISENIQCPVVTRKANV